MRPEQIHEAMCHLEPQLVEEAARPVQRGKKRLRPFLIAACLSLVIAIPAMAAAGNLLVKVYNRSNMPEHLAGQELDAYYEAVNPEKIPLAALSEEARQDAAEQGDVLVHHGFDSWDAIEDYLGINILDNEVITNARPRPVKVMDQDGQVVLNTPGSLMLVTDPDGQLIGINGSYYCVTATGKAIELYFMAATELNEHDSSGSLGVDFEGGTILHQTSEVFQTESGHSCTIVRTKDSLGETWTVDAWILQHGFTVRLSLTSQSETSADLTIKEILNAFE